MIRDIVKKSGRSGELAFVTVGYRILQENALCLEEEQDIVYRQPGPPLSAPEPAELPPVPDGAWSRNVVPDTRLLFRFSALTFNAHRIHYDRPYAMQEEGYPGLVVHGPLTAMLLLQLVRDNTSRPVNVIQLSQPGATLRFGTISTSSGCRPMEASNWRLKAPIPRRRWRHRGAELANSDVWVRRWSWRKRSLDLDRRLKVGNW